MTVIVSCIALAVSVAALVFAIRNARETRRHERQTWANISLAQVYNSRTSYYMRQAASLRARNRRPA